ncbi:MAG: hypothetical protein COB08_011520 [Rhodobacteraceae bacterium]|nr:hypothetical protein [Paracoccaceae bacterium]
MTSNIIAIRAAQTQVPQLRTQLRALHTEAMANDGVIDADEQAEIDELEGMIDSAQRLVTERLQAWETNKTAYERLRSDLESSLDKVASNESDALSRDKRAISTAAARVDQTAATEDYAAALVLVKELKRRVELFLQQAENERLNGLTSEELAQISLADDAIEEVFTEEYMQALMTIEFKGEGTPELKDLIKKIEKGLSSTNRTEVIEDLADVVGKPPSAAELDADYARFLILCKQRDAIGDEGGHAVPDPVDEEKHPDFVGSHEQLMFGKVLGDALGIHEVFATLLSPTGGLVGPGNDLIPGYVSSPHLSPDNPIALHGTVHDAAGYLDSYHNDGPGYNYMDSDFDAGLAATLEFFGAEALLPLTGQVSGIAYWTAEAGDEYVEARFDEGVVALEKMLEDARDSASDQIDEIVFAIEEAKQEMSDAADSIKDSIVDAAKVAEQELQELADEIEAEVLEARDAFEDGVDKVSRAAVETYEEASAAARSLGEGAKEKLNALANFIWN